MILAHLGFEWTFTFLLYANVYQFTPFIFRTDCQFHFFERNFIGNSLLFAKSTCPLLCLKCLPAASVYTSYNLSILLFSESFVFMFDCMLSERSQVYIKTSYTRAANDDKEAELERIKRSRIICFFESLLIQR